MNFLAHLYLSGDAEHIKVGNFIGDFVKGSDWKNYDKEVKVGILLHRAIDSFTDNHSITTASKKRLFSVFGHYSGVIVDMFYDHFLALNWENYKRKSLIKYAQETYQVLDKHKAIFPVQAKTTLYYMTKYNWLASYAKIEGIQQAFMGLQRRTKFTIDMVSSIVYLQQHYDQFNKEFVLFFEELEKFVAQKIYLIKKDVFLPKE